MFGFKWLSLATIAATIDGFAMLIISARALPNTVNLQFVTFWGLFFALTGALGGLMQETTHAIGAAESQDREQNREREQGQERGVSETDQTLGARPITVSLGVAAVTFIAMAVAGPLWAPLVMRDDTGTAILLMAFGLVLYSMQAIASGLLSGRQLWGPYAALIMIDILMRVVLTFVAWYFDWGLLAWLIITVFSAVSWLILALSSPATHSVMFTRADIPMRRFTTLIVTAMGTSDISAMLVTGFPTIVKVAGGVVATGAEIAESFTPPHADNSTAAITIVGVVYAVTLTRIPLLMSLEKFQNAIIVSFVRHRSESILAALVKPLGTPATFGIFGAGLTWLIGPWIITLIPGDSYHVSGPVLAALTLGATLTAMLMVTGSVTLAVEEHHMYLVGWLAATTIAVAILSLPGHLPVRTVAAIAVGSAVSVAIHLPALRTLSPKTAKSAVSEAFAVE